MVTSKQELGHLRANSEANKNNNLTLPGCDSCGEVTVCQDTLVVALADGEALISITWQGNVIDLSGIAALDDAAPTVLTNALLDLLIAALSTDYIDEDRPYLYGNLPKEVMPGITVTWAADELTVVHIGEGTLETLVTDGGSSTDDRVCTWANTCVGYLQGVDELGALSYNGAAGVALANDPYAHTGVLITDDATAVQLAADLATALTTAGAVYYEIAVVNNATAGAYDMYIRYAYGDTVELATAGLFVDAKCEEYAGAPA